MAQAVHPKHRLTFGGNIVMHMELWLMKLLIGDGRSGGS